MGKNPWNLPGRRKPVEQVLSAGKMGLKAWRLWGFLGGPDFPKGAARLELTCTSLGAHNETKKRGMPCFGAKLEESCWTVWGRGCQSHFPSTAPVPVFEALVRKDDEVFASFLGFLETRFALCKPCGVFQSFLGSLQASGGLYGAAAAVPAVGKILAEALAKHPPIVMSFVARKERGS